MKILFFLIFTSTIYGQNLKIVSDEELCHQIKLCIDYLNNDSELNVKNFKFDSILHNGLYYGFFQLEYVKNQLNIGKEELLNFENEKVNQLFNKLENIEHSKVKLNLDCIKIKQNSNVTLSKLDKDNLLLNIKTIKNGYMGIAYLFFFKDGKIINVEKKAWII